MLGCHDAGYQTPGPEATRKSPGCSQQTRLGILGVIFCVRFLIHDLLPSLLRFRNKNFLDIVIISGPISTEEGYMHIADIYFRNNTQLPTNLITLNNLFVSMF